jgi:hypothetical protein
LLEKASGMVLMFLVTTALHRMDELIFVDTFEPEQMPDGGMLTGPVSQGIVGTPYGRRRVVKKQLPFAAGSRLEMDAGFVMI